MTSLATAAPVSPTRASLARSSGLSFAGSVISAALGLVLIIVLGRTLGDAGSGVVLQCIAAFTIALAVARLGMDSSALWILPRQLDGEREQVRSTGWFLVSVSAIGGVIGALGLWGFAALQERVDPGSLTAETLRATASFLPLASVLLTALAATRALGRVTAYVVIGNIVLPVLRPVCILAIVGLGGGAVLAGVAWAVPLLPAAAAAVIVLGIQLGRNGTPGRGSFRTSGVPARVAAYATPRVLSAVLEQLLVWVAVLMVGSLSGPAAAGVYGTAARFVAAGMIVDTALRVVVSPLFGRLFHRGDTAGLEELYRTATIWLVLFSSPVYVTLAIFSPTVLSLLGDAFQDGAIVLTVMCVGALATFLAGNIHSVLLMSGRSGLAALNKVLAVAVNVVLIFLLVPWLGVVGAAVAWVIACVLDATLASLEVRWMLRLRVSPLPAARPLLIGLVTVAGPALVLRLALGASWTALIISVAVGGVLLMTTCWIDRDRLHLTALAQAADRRDHPSRNGVA